MKSAGFKRIKTCPPRLVVYTRSTFKLFSTLVLILAAILLTANGKQISKDFSLPISQVCLVTSFFYRSPVTFNQCCGSGSGIRCFFDPWIRDG
jgi:hypothetical protein